MGVDGGKVGFKIMQQGREWYIRTCCIIHSSKSISGEYSGVRCSRSLSLLPPLPPPPLPPNGFLFYTVIY